MSSHHVSINLSLWTLIHSTLLSDAALHKFANPDFCMHIESTYCRGKRKMCVSAARPPCEKEVCLIVLNVNW